MNSFSDESHSNVRGDPDDQIEQVPIDFSQDQYDNGKVIKIRILKRSDVMLRAVRADNEKIDEYFVNDCTKEEQGDDNVDD